MLIASKSQNFPPLQDLYKLPYFALGEHLIQILIRFPYLKAGIGKDLVEMMASVFVCRVGRKAGKRAVESPAKELLIFFV